MSPFRRDDIILFFKFQLIVLLRLTSEHVGQDDKDLSKKKKKNKFMTIHGNVTKPPIHMEQHFAFIDL